MTWTIHTGDCLEVMRQLPAQHFHVCVSSPPYFALRSYLPDGHPDKAKEIGSEPTPDQFIAAMVAVYREVWRVLRDDGVCWMNLGDGYCSQGGERAYGSSDGATGRGPGTKRLDGLIAKPGDLLMMPHRVALALQADGWWVRNDVVWAKRSPMPESIGGTRWEKCRVKVGPSNRINGEKKAYTTDGKPHGGRDESGKGFESSAQWSDCHGCPKCIPNGGYVLRRGSWRHTRAHEFVFQLAKSPKYFADAQAVAEVATGGAPGNKRLGKASGVMNNGIETRNPRSFLLLANEPSKEQHFASFPTELVRPLLLAATSEKGCCPKCGAAIARIIEKHRLPTRPGTDCKVWKSDNYDTIGQRSHGSPNRDPERHIQRTVTLGWKPTCQCGIEATDGVPMRVLDMFAGTGTTGVVARRLGLDFDGIELNPEYVEIAKRKIKGDATLLNAS